MIWTWLGIKPHWVGTVKAICLRKLHVKLNKFKSRSKYLELSSPNLHDIFSFSHNPEVYMYILYQIGFRGKVFYAYFDILKHVYTQSWAKYNVQKVHYLNFLPGLTLPYKWVSFFYKDTIKSKIRKSNVSHSIFYLFPNGKKENWRLPENKQ